MAENIGRLAEPLSGQGAVPSVVAPPPRPAGRWSRWGLQAWMLVLPVDALMAVSPALWFPRHILPLALTAVLTVLAFSVGGRYRAKLHLSVLDELPSIVSHLLVVIAIVGTLRALWFLAVDPTAITSRDNAGTVALVLTLPVIVHVVLGRCATTSALLWARRRRLVAHPTILVGGGVTAAELATLLRRHARYGLDVVGFVDDCDRSEAMFVVPRLGPVSALSEAVATYGVDVLLVTGGHRSDLELLALLREPDCASCDILVVPRLYSLHTQTGVADHIGSIPVLRIRRPSLNGLARVVKRITGVVLAGTALLALSPLMALCALAVRLEGGPGVIFRQERVGRDGRHFQCLKFRSMKPTTETESATQWNIAQDHRVGRVGRFLRRTSLDELPQLWNIVRGDMALVGPRPERPHFVEQFSDRYIDYGPRHRVPVGLTGLAQVSGLRGDTPISDRARFDNYYVENWSLWLDVKVLLRTVSEVLLARGR
ncbi:sugar transferase [Actinomycetospora sp. NBC_00405]|uniref:sugar transferase n=1 Tax=Actinomycetospora sp. NBC_00405 TaxID=2975952 RepID=UPI002E2211C5